MRRANHLSQTEDDPTPPPPRGVAGEAMMNGRLFIGIPSPSRYLTVQERIHQFNNTDNENED